MPAPWNYPSGEPVRRGDVVTLGRWPGVVVDLITGARPDRTEPSGEVTGEGVLFEGPDFGRLLADTLGPDVRLVRRAGSDGTSAA
jgi:hypothetical protein